MSIETPPPGWTRPSKEVRLQRQGDRFRWLRHELTLTQVEAAKFFTIKERTWQHWEGMTASPTIPNLRLVIGTARRHGLEISPSWLLGEIE